MTKKTRSTTRLLGALLAASMLLTACGGEGETSSGSQTTGDQTSSSGGTSVSDDGGEGWTGDPNINEPGVFPVCKETVALSVAVPQNANVIDWETNEQTKWLEEKGNFDLSFEVYPSSEMTTQLTLSVTAGGDDLPGRNHRRLE